MSVDGHGTGTCNKAVLNSVTRPLTTLNSGVFALGVAKRPNWEPAELYRKDPVERPMAGLLCDNTRRFLHSHNRRRFSTARRTFGRNFYGLRPLRTILLDGKKSNCDDVHKEIQGVPAVLAKDLVLSISCARTQHKNTGIKTRESGQQRIGALQTHGGWAKPQWFTRLRRDARAVVMFSQFRADVRR